MIKRSTEIRQKQIKKAIIQIVSKEGIKGISTRRVAEKVGVSEGALFKHFKTKRNMILSIVDDVEKELVSPLEDIAFSNKKAKEKLGDFLCKHIIYLVKNKGITILLFSQAVHSNDPKLKSEMKKIMMAQKAALANIVKDGIKEKIWSSKINIEDFTTLYMGIPVVLNIEIVLKGKNAKPSNFCTRMMKMLESILRGK